MSDEQKVKYFEVTLPHPFPRYVDPQTKLEFVRGKAIVSTNEEDIRNDPILRYVIGQSNWQMEEIKPMEVLKVGEKLYRIDEQEKPKEDRKNIHEPEVKKPERLKL